jgi:DHA1 family multidrug resistance protein-like MFS transporter
VSWRRNLFAVTTAGFIGFTGFTLVMPFLPLYIAQLGVTDVGEIALWSGLSIGITPALTAIMSPIWGRLADRVGRKIMVERALVSFIVVMAAMAFVTRPWHVFALRGVQGFFAGYGAIILTMAAESAPRDRLASSIGLVQTAQRLGPAIGPVIGALVAGLVGLRQTFLVTAGVYLLALVVMFFAYQEAPRERRAVLAPKPRLTFRDVLGFENFALLMAVIFGVQFVDRSFGPILPLYVEEVGVPNDRVALVAGVLFSILAATAAFGHHMCEAFLRRWRPRHVLSAAAILAAAAVSGLAAVEALPLLMVCVAVFGFGVGVAMTAAFTAGGSVIPAGAQGAGFGFLTSASLSALAIGPTASGLLSGVSLRVVFFVDAAVLLGVAWMVRRGMVDTPVGPPTTGAVDET